MQPAPQPSNLLAFLLRRGAPEAGQLAQHAEGAKRFPPALTGGERVGKAKVDWFTMTWQPEPDEVVSMGCFEWFTQDLGGVMGESVNGMYPIMKKIALLAGFTGIAASAHAELPAAVATAITEYQTDTLEAIALVIAAGVAVWALMRLAQKLGWR